MSIEAVKAITSTPVAKDPPWGAQDLGKLRILMDQGFTAAEMARELGTTIGDVSQKIAALTASVPATNPTGSSSGAEETNQHIGNNLDIKA